MDVGDDGDSQVACLGGRNDNRARRGRLADRRVPAAEDDGPGRSPSVRARPAQVLQRLGARADGALRAVRAHRRRALARRGGRRAARARETCSEDRAEHGAGADRRRDDRRGDHARRPVGGRPPVLDGASLVGSAPRPDRRLVGRLARRAVGPARRRRRLRDAPGCGRHVLRAALSAELVAPGDADLPRARGRLPGRLPVPGRRSDPSPFVAGASPGRTDARAGGGHRHARRRREGERPHDTGERVLGRPRPNGAGRRLGHAPEEAVHERRGSGRPRARVRAHRAPPPLEGARLGCALHVPARLRGRPHHRQAGRTGQPGPPALRRARPAAPERRDHAAHERRLTPLRGRGGLVGAEGGQGSLGPEEALPAVRGRRASSSPTRRPGRTSSSTRTRRSCSGSRWPRPGSSASSRRRRTADRWPSTRW